MPKLISCFLITYLDGAIQLDLTITPDNQPQITVDNLEVAQFIYLLLNNQKIRHIINTITSKVVLILGRFTPKRKQVLDAIRDELRNHDLLPVVFDFDNAPNRNLTETIKTLAGMSRFIIADITDPRSIPQELYAIVPHFPSIPVQPLIHVSKKPYGIYESIAVYPWVLPIHPYQDIPSLLPSLKEKVIEPAEQKAKKLEKSKRRI